MKYSNFIIVSILAMMSCKAQNNSQLPVETTKQVDLAKYTGIWYEISTIPAHFQKGCRCTTAEYQLDPSGYIRVTNRCVADGKFKKIEGKAFVVKNTGNARLKVQFFGLLRAIIVLWSWPTIIHGRPLVPKAGSIYGYFLAIRLWTTVCTIKLSHSSKKKALLLPA